MHYLLLLLVELQAKYRTKVSKSNGTLYVGEKGILYTGDRHGGRCTSCRSQDGGKSPNPPRRCRVPSKCLQISLLAVREG